MIKEIKNKKHQAPSPTAALSFTSILGGNLSPFEFLILKIITWHISPGIYPVNAAVGDGASCF
jgi:hypothetical protein